MSPREAVWRVQSAAALSAYPLGRRPLHIPTWRGPWSQRLHALAYTRRDRLVAAAERIASGERDLWGRAGLARLERDGALAAATRYGDRKPLCELNRQQHLFPLAAGAALAGRSDWGRLCCDELLGWIARHTRQYWDSGYETAHRLVGWAWTVPFLLEFLTDAELHRISLAYAEQAAFTAVRPSLHSSANNHRLAELTGLLAASAVGAERDWNALWSELEEQVTIQTYADGGSREQSGGYFLYVLEILWVAAAFATATGRPLGQLEERLRAMLRWLEQVADLNGEPPPLGDDAEDRMLRIEYFEPRRASAIAGRVRALLAGNLTLAPAAGAVEATSVVLPESGLAIFRNAGRRVVVDVGELGFGKLAAHGHPDALSLLADSAGRPFLRDSGTCVYAPPPPRERHRATAAHNTVVIDRRNQAQALGPHLWGRRFTTTLEAHASQPQLDYVRASHDGYRPAVHARSVSFLKPDLVIVLDRVTSPRECEATLVWQRPPDPPPFGLTVASMPASAHAEGEGPFSPRYTWCMEAPRSTWTAHGFEIVFATVISFAGPPPELAADHVLGETLVEVAGRRLVERWQGGAIEVQA